MSWPIVTLNDIAINIVDGPFGSSLKTSDYVDEGVPVLQGKNITGNRFKFFDVRHITEKKAESIKRSTVKVGDHLLVKIGSIGYSAIIDDLYGHDFAIIPANLAKITPNKEVIDSRYLHRYLTSDSAIRYFQKIASKTAQPALSLSKIKALEIPLPPLAEQRRIASILDQADVLRQKRQQAIEKLDQLLQATFIDMFGDPVSNPKGWDLVRVGEVVEEFIGGKNIECPDESDSDYKILKVSAVTSKVYKPNESKFAPNTFEPNPLAIVEKGDLLFSRANTTELVAATAYVWETPENIVLPDKLWKFSISDESKVNKLYLWDLFKNIEFRNELSKLSSGTSGSMKNISKGKLNELKMPLPPKELQDKFAEFSTKLWGQIKTFQQSSDSLDSLFNSLQNQAFNGTL